MVTATAVSVRHQYSYAEEDLVANTSCQILFRGIILLSIFF